MFIVNITSKNCNLTSKSSNPISRLILFCGLILIPNLGFSQQEQPKRVTVVVIAKEIIPEKEIIQIPADNFPKATNSSVHVNGERKIKRSALAKTPIKERSVKKASNLNTVSKTEVSSNTSKTSAQINDKRNSIIKSKSSQTADSTAIRNNIKAGSFSYVYIWIGAFFVIAGVVLGLLFGKPAFLISFAGLVFIVLGVII